MKNLLGLSVAIVLSACDETPVRRSPGSGPPAFGCANCIAAGLLCGESGDGSEAACSSTCAAEHRCGASACCVRGSTCLADTCQAADLRINDTTELPALRFVDVDVADTDCIMQAGCALAAGRRRLVQVSALVENHGAAPLDLADPALFNEDACGTPVLPSVLGFVLADAGGITVAQGDFATGCVSDEAAFDPAAVPAFYTCTAQGLLPGWSTHQPGAASCDSIDVTDLAPGEYTLTVGVNLDQRLAETDYTNNTAVVSLTLCDGDVCGDVCCPAGFCSAGRCQMPDLGVDAATLAESLTIYRETFPSDSCALTEGCIDAPGDRRLLGFTTLTPNLGYADVEIGVPWNNPDMVWAPCHNHYHLDGYADYRLLDSAGTPVGAGHKQAFCLLDSMRWRTDADPNPTYSCSYQGISAGWADSYPASLDCQWIDITDLPPGDYFLEVSINPDRVLLEYDYGNNVALMPVSIPPDPTVCVPAPEICGDGVDQDCDRDPDNGCPPITGNNTCASAHLISAASAVVTAALDSSAGADASLPCGGAGADIFFRVDVTTDEILYASTYGSLLDTTLAIFKDSCDPAATQACSDDDCALTQSSLALNATPGTYYIAVKAKAAGGSGDVKLKLLRSGCLTSKWIDAPGTYNGDTSSSSRSTTTSCGSGRGRDDLWAMSACPGATPLALTTCGGTSFDSVLEVRAERCNGPVAPAACDDDDPTCGNSTASRVETLLQGSGAGDSLWFIVVDGWGSNDDGPYALEVSY